MEPFLLKLTTYFIIYSFLGWVMESVVRSISEKKIINTGFLIGPFCPIYGIGAIILFLFLERFSCNMLLLFIMGVVVLTLWEYLVGVLLEVVFKTKYWDYSHNKFNFQGRICLTNSLCWGILGIVFIQYLHPFMVSIIEKVDINLLHYLVVVCCMIILVDFITSVTKVFNMKATLDKVEELNKEIKEKLKELKTFGKDTSKTKENMQQVIEELKKKRNRIIRHLYRNVYRLKKAFPTINSKEIAEILNKKIEVKKKGKKAKEEKE